MSDVWVGGLIGVGGTVLGAVVAFFLEMWRKRIDERKRTAEKALVVFSRLKGLSYEMIECAEEALRQSFNYNYATARKEVNFKFGGSQNEWEGFENDYVVAFESFKNERRRFISFIGKCQALLLEFMAYMESGQSMEEFTHPLLAYVIDPFNNLEYFSYDFLGAPELKVHQDLVENKSLTELQKIFENIFKAMEERYFHLSKTRIERVV